MSATCSQNIRHVRLTFGRLWLVIFVADSCWARTFLANETPLLPELFFGFSPAACSFVSVPLTAGTVAVAAFSAGCTAAGALALVGATTGTGGVVRGASPSARSSICQSS